MNSDEATGRMSVSSQALSLEQPDFDWSWFVYVYSVNRANELDGLVAGLMRLLLDMDVITLMIHPALKQVTASKMAHDREVMFNIKVTCSCILDLYVRRRLLTRMAFLSYRAVPCMVYVEDSMR